jgi:hypothetical protein
MTLPIKFFDSTMQGAPQLNNSFGALTSLLDALLITGFNLKVVNALTRSGDVATAHIASGHLYRVGQVLQIAGADQPEYNGEIRVDTVTTNTFTYALSGSPISPATGTSIGVKVAPLGWEIAFTGSCKRAYRSANLLSHRPYLRVDDGQDPVMDPTWEKKGKVTMAQGMSDIDTFVGARAPFDPAMPTKNEIGTGSGGAAYDGWYKWPYARVGGYWSSSASAPAAYARPWALVGDDRGFYLFNEAIDSGGLGGVCFTDFESYRSEDGFNTLLAARDLYISMGAYNRDFDGDSFNVSDYRTRFVRTLDPLGKILMRGHLQVGSPVNVSFTSLNTNNGQTVSGLTTGIAWPNGPDYALLLHPVLIKEGTSLRGKLPGMFWIHNDRPDFVNYDTVTGVAGYPGRTFVLIRCAHGGEPAGALVAFDITGPWW